MITKKALVTGGAGFLGTALIRKLLAIDKSVICVDNFSTGSLNNLQEFMAHPKFSYRKQDIAKPFEVEVDEIYNLACPASPKHYQRDPLQTIRSNVLGSWHLLELARALKIKIFQASTSEVYGDPWVHPQKESYVGAVNPIGKRACYDEGKRLAETLFFEYHRLYAVPIRVARIFNTYGPGMHPEDGRVMSNFIVQALTGSPLTLYGDGLQTRSFCYVEDLVEGIIAFMGHPSLVGPVNLGNPQEITMLDLAKKIIALTDSSSCLLYQELPEDDPKLRKPDITLATERLSWQPKISLDKGLIPTICFFKKSLLEKQLDRSFVL